MYYGRLVALDTPAGLRATGLRGVLLAVDCDRPMDALARLQALPGVQEAVLYGLELHVIVEPGLSPEMVGRALVEVGIAVRAVHPIAPSLEDVFISLLSAPG